MQDGALVWLQRGGVVVVCAIGATVGTAHAGGPAAFTDEAIARGIDYDVPFVFTQFGCGLACVDLDGDRDPDVVVTGRSDGVVGVYENDGTGNFTDRSATSGIPAIMKPSSISAADYDADGDLDLLITCYFEPNLLLRNDGNLVFTDVSVVSGVNDDGPGMGAAWADWNGDGWVDVYAPNRTGTDNTTIPNRMYENNGDGTFTDKAFDLGVDRHEDPTLVVTFLDYDRDGDADLYIGNDKGAGPDWQNHLFQNDGTGHFTDVTAATGTAAHVDCMGIGVGDLNHTGFQDLYVTNAPIGNVLMMNQGNGTFLEQQAAAGVESFALGWGTLFFDYDNDTWHEIQVCNGTAADRLYDLDGTWPGTDIADDLGIAHTGFSYCVATGDVDNDGDLDLLVQGVNQPIHLYINHEGETREWIKLDVRGQGNNTHAIGGRVHVRTGSLWQMREIRSGTNYKSQNELLIHFGLDQAMVADEVRVVWPGGDSRTVFGLTSGSTWTMYPQEALGDADQDGDVELDDFLALLACRDAGVVTPGCEMMDLDGDADVDDLDVDAFVLAYTGTLDDCNGNGTADLLDIAGDPALDANEDGVLDSCACPADIDGDGHVGFSDLSDLLNAWGLSAPHVGDLNGSGKVDFGDLTMMIAAWGSCG